MNGGVWTALIFNSEESPLVSDAFLLEKLLEYGGEESPEYQIKVQGRFPENGDGFLIGRKSVERVVGAARTIRPDEPYGHLVVIDVGAGVHRDKTVVNHFHVTGNGDRLDADPRRVDHIAMPVYSNSLDWATVARQATDYCAALSNATVLVDIGGQGVQFAKMMESLGCANVIHINWGLYNFKKRLKERFFNQRAQCVVQTTEAIRDGRLSLLDAQKKDLLDQASRTPFHIDEKGRWHIMPKDKMKEEGIPSPDYWDTVAMAFLEDAHYIVADDSYKGGGAQKQATLDAMAEAMAALEAQSGAQ